MDLSFLDLRTLLTIYPLTALISSVVIFLVYNQNKHRFRGINYWVLALFMQFVALILINLREIIPLFISIVVANFIANVGILTGLFGIGKFYNVKVIRYPNYILLVVGTLVHTYFTFIEPNLSWRDFNSATIFFIFSLEYIWLLFNLHKKHGSNSIRFAGIVFILYAILNAVRVIKSVIIPHNGTDFFHSGSFNSVVMLSFILLIVLFTYSLVLMFNERLSETIKLKDEKFRKAFQSSPYAISLTRLSDGKILDVNRGFELLSGFQSDELVGHTTSEMNFWPSPEERNQIVSQLSEFGRIQNLEIAFKTRNGNFLTTLFSADVIEIENEVCVVSSINNISDRIKNLEALKASEKELRELNATKDKFFSIIAHDLKNPFNSIIGFSALLQDQIESQDYEGLTQNAVIIQASAQKAYNLLVNLLEWSRSQTGHMEFRPENFKVQEVAEEVIELLSDTAYRKRISLNTDIPKDLVVFADKAMISTVIRNLIANALKYSNLDGMVKLIISVEPDAILFKVSDNGIGIPAEILPKLFHIEANIQTKGTGNETGTGLGLLLCKEFVAKHSGKIWAESTFGNGSVFSFTIPQKKETNIY